MNRLKFHGNDVREYLPEEAYFHFLPIPLEQSVSYEGGTVAGPAAILRASCQLELLECGIIPAEKGLYTSPAICCNGDIEKILDNIVNQVVCSLNAGALPIILGGEHTVSLGAVKALQQVYGNDFAVVQFDAHADLRDSYTGTGYSHACVLRRIHEFGIPVYQLGTRSYCGEEDEYRKKHDIWYKDAEEIWDKGAKSIFLPPDCPENIYLTFDVDVWDTSLMPATGTPVPGGLDWYQSIWLVESVLAGRKLIGADFVELAPVVGMHGYDFAVAQFIYRVMSMVC